MTEIKITETLLILFDACDTGISNARSIFGNGFSISLGDVLNSDKVSFSDKIWIALQRDLFFTGIELRDLACDFAALVLPLYERQCPSDNRVRGCIEKARLFNKGLITDQEMAAARDAAWAAAWAAAEKDILKIILDKYEQKKEMKHAQHSNPIR